MARIPCHLVALLLSALVAGCGAAAAPDAIEAAVSAGAEAAQAEIASVVTPVTEEAQEAAAQALVPTALAIQEAVQGSPVAPSVEPRPAWAAAPVASALILRWEVGSEAQYRRKWEGIICPGGLSGPTGGIGYDFGHQTATDIRAAWSDHPDVDRLVTASGIVGDANCRAWRSQHLDIRIPFEHADQVFQVSTLPAYASAAGRALADGWEQLPPNAQAGNVSMGYNRGWSMRGDRNREKRAIRDTCVPVGDVGCNAREIRAMKRLWPDVRGLRDRRDDEASTVERPS